MDYHWNWMFFFQETDDGLKYYDWVLSGLGWTTIVSLASLAGRAAFGLSSATLATGATTAALAFFSAISLAVLPNVHPPQVKPMTASATAPTPAP